MAFQVSPGVSVTEKDLTNVIPAVSTTSGGIVITAEKGPIGEITTISSEKQLVDTFGKPNASNFEQWFTAANFLGYGNNLKVVRPVTGMVNAGVSGTPIIIKSTTDYTDNYGHAADFAAAVGGGRLEAGADSLADRKTANISARRAAAAGLAAATGKHAPPATRVCHGPDSGGALSD